MDPDNSKTLAIPGTTTRRWILLIRHGETAWNAERRFMGTSDVPLNALGHDQARHLAESLPTDRIHRVFTSPLARAAQTASYLHPDPVREAGLRELAQGELEGMSAADAIARFPVFFEEWSRDCAAVTVPGGESMLDCQRRGLAAVHAVAARCPAGATCAAVGHQMVIASVLCAAEGRRLADWREYRLPNCGVALVAVLGDRIELVKHQWSPTADTLPVHYSGGP